MVDESPAAVEEPKEEKQPKAKRNKAKKSAKKKRAAVAGTRRGAAGQVAYPKDPLAKSLRIPQAILEQNAGNACTPKEAAAFARIGWTGEVGVEISSATKYGLLERPPGKVKPTELVRKIVRPEDPKDRLEALRQAVMTAPVISDMYKRYRGEYLPDKEFRRTAGRDWAEGGTMNKVKRSAEQQIADEADRRALHPLTARQTILESQATPEFQKNHMRLRADRLAREAELKAKGK